MRLDPLTFLSRLAAWIPPPRAHLLTYYSWAQLMRRVFGIDVLLCDRCGDRRKVLTFLTDPDVIGRILLHRGEPVELPEVAPARSPPGGGWLFR